MALPESAISATGANKIREEEAPMPKKPTSRDVAALAGVSQSAVSFILNNKERTSFNEETKRKVFQAAKELGYQIPKRKETLSKQRLILVLVPTFENQYYAELGHTLENLADKMGMKAMVCCTSRKPSQEEYFLDFFISLGIDAVIYAFLPSFPERVRMIDKEIPVVLIGEKTEDFSISSIELSNVKGASIMGEHLYELGHRRFAFITTNINRISLSRRQRLEGIMQMAARCGIEEDAIEVISPSENVEETETYNHLQPYEYAIGKSLAKKSLQSGTRATAFIGVNDMVALGVCHALAEEGIKVPEDCSVCGFDNIFLSSVAGITTIDHNFSLRCRAALDLVMSRLDSGAFGSFAYASKIEFSSNLVKRGSTGPSKR
jgi:LacI family transcriptional regulator